MIDKCEVIIVYKDNSLKKVEFGNTSNDIDTLLELMMFSERYFRNGMVVIVKRDYDGDGEDRWFRRFKKICEMANIYGFMCEGDETLEEGMDLFLSIDTNDCYDPLMVKLATVNLGDGEVWL